MKMPLERQHGQSVLFGNSFQGHRNIASKLPLINIKFYGPNVEIMHYDET